MGWYIARRHGVPKKASLLPCSCSGFVGGCGAYEGISGDSSDQPCHYVMVRHIPCFVELMETTGTRQQLRELQDDLESLTHEYQSLQIRLYDRWSQVQWLKVQGGAKTVTSASLATEIETMRARQVVLRETIRELKAHIRALQSTR